MPVRDNKYKLRALLILIVFGLSLLPRQVLHNFVTNHKHIKWAGHPGKAQLSAETFNCSADNLFLQQNYHSTAYSFSPGYPAPGILINKTLVCLRDNDNPDFSFLRGPPAIS
ncbi:MAG: hypothetical protein EOO04_30890 [Chitinophagaceae bacterium]|nr:MAG: hypothetical protein EOO04_30890 [Chitinophagaceae bacterium]